MSMAASPPACEARRFGVVVMGVAGCGKTSVAELLAKQLGVPLIEGDALHPQANIAKMSQGIPLTDEDRWPWLERIAQEVGTGIARSGCAVATCSALRKVYRDRLRAGAGHPLYFVFLEGTRELLFERMSARRGHFMPVTLLDSQLQTLENPSNEDGVVTVGIDMTVEKIAAAALQGLEQLRSRGRE